MKRLEGYFNPTATAYLRRAARAEATAAPTDPDVTEVAFTNNDYDKVDPSKYNNMFSIPKSYQEAWNHPCPWQRKRWRDAITKEILKVRTGKV
jgi:hypothetical protein